MNSIRDIVSNRFIQFGYDGKGNRIYKNVITPLPSGEGKEQHEGEYYVRDAGGNILATYRFHSKFNKQATLHELIGRLTPLPAGPLVPGGTPLTEVVTGLTDRSFPTLMIAKMLSDHSSWSGVYTDRPVSFYMSADPSLKSNLLYTGDAWIDELRSVNPMVYRSSFLDAGTDVQGFYESALSLPGEGRKILEHYSREMPLSVCQSIWAIAQAPYLPGNHPVNANALYSAAGSSSSPAHNAVLNALVTEVDRNNRDSLPHAAGFYGALVSDGSLWSSSALRDNNGPWTIGIRELTNKYASDTALASFFDGWSGGAAALDGAVAPDYKLTTVYNASPARSLTDMVLEAGPAEAEDVVTAEEDVTAYEWGKIAFEKGVLSATDFEEAMSYGSSGDTLSLAEHHIYGSSRLGVQRYDSLGLANITHLPAESAMYARTTLNNRRPWYSYTYADLIDREKRTEYDGTVNTCTDTLYNSRTLGRRYYELTDHLGNVLATVLDRKTGAGTAPGSGGTLYDHWSADIASSADYYPGGFIMPGRYTEHDWSRMGAQGSPKDDEVYGKGNYVDLGARSLDTRIIRLPTPDPLAGKHPQTSPYAYAGNKFTMMVDDKGMEEKYFKVAITFDEHGKIAVTNYQQVKSIPTIQFRAPLKDNGYFGSQWQNPIVYTPDKNIYTIDVYEQRGNATQLVGTQTISMVPATSSNQKQYKDHRTFNGWMLTSSAREAGVNSQYEPNAGSGSKMYNIDPLLDAFGSINSTLGDIPANKIDWLHFGLKFPTEIGQYLQKNGVNVDGAVDKAMNGGNKKYDTSQCPGGCGLLEVTDQNGNRQDAVEPAKGKSVSDY